MSRRAAITGTANITLGGRTVIMADVHLRGDLHSTRTAPSSSGKEATPTAISIGRCTVISTGSVIRPPYRTSRGQIHYYPMKIGDNVFIGEYFMHGTPQAHSSHDIKARYFRSADMGHQTLAHKPNADQNAPHQDPTAQSLPSKSPATSTSVPTL